MPGRNHSRDFKLEVVGQINAGLSTTAQLCREHSLSERAGLKPCTLVQVFQIFRVWVGLLQSACERQPDWEPYHQQAHGASGVGDEVSVPRANR